MIALRVRNGDLISISERRAKALVMKTRKGFRCRFVLWQCPRGMNGGMLQHAVSLRWNDKVEVERAGK